MSMSCSLTTLFHDPERFNRGVWGALFGEEIQLRREERGLSVEQAAQRAGLRSEDWQAIEAGQVPESWEQVCAVGDGREAGGHGVPGNPLRRSLGGRPSPARPD